MPFRRNGGVVPARCAPATCSANHFGSPRHPHPKLRSGHIEENLDPSGESHLRGFHMAVSSESLNSLTTLLPISMVGIRAATLRSVTATCQTWSPIRGSRHGRCNPQGDRRCGTLTRRPHPRGPRRCRLQGEGDSYGAFSCSPRKELAVQAAPQNEAGRARTSESVVSKQLPGVRLHLLLTGRKEL